MLKNEIEGLKSELNSRALSSRRDDNTQPCNSSQSQISTLKYQPNNPFILTGYASLLEKFKKIIHG